MYDGFQEMYGVFLESSYDCLDPQSTVRLGKADSQAFFSFSVASRRKGLGVYLYFPLCISFGLGSRGSPQEEERARVAVSRIRDKAPPCHL